MRLLAAATATLLVLLAGCALPGAEEEPEDDPLFGLCPQWVQGGGGQTGGFVLNGTANRTVELGPAANESAGQPLDLYRVNLTTLDVDGRLELRAFDANGRQLAVRDYRQEAPQLVPVVVFTDGSAEGHEFEVFLSTLTSDGDASPAPVSLRWSLDGAAAEVGFDVTYHYKVCGSGDA
jgi:hypothetical protein